MPDPFVTVDRRADGVALVRLDRPKANALSGTVLGQIYATAQALHDDPPGAVVLWGGRRIFAAGADIVELEGNGPTSVGANFTAALGALASVPRVTIAAINGYALGGGLELALACDLRVACPEARFGLPEVRLGIPSVVDAALLHHYVGLSRAREIILTGAMYSVADLASSGLANRVAERGQLRAAAGELLAGLRELTPQVLAAQKALFETWLNTGLRASIDASVEVFADLFADPATAAAVAAYQRRLASRG